VSRDDGFAIADVSVAFLRDPKVRQLRSVGLEGGAAVLIYLGIVLSSWEHGKRLTLAESDVPFPATPERIAMLREVGMIDAKLRIPTAIWAAWFGPARARKLERREAGRRGGLAKARNARATSNGVAELVATPYPSVPSSSVVPPNPPPVVGNGSRANGTSPRALAKVAEAARLRELEERRAAVQEINQRYYRGEISEAQKQAAILELGHRAEAPV
jgi:hypothetical protein